MSKVILVGVVFAYLPLAEKELLEINNSGVDYAIIDQLITWLWNEIAFWDFEEIKIAVEDIKSGEAIPSIAVANDKAFLYLEWK